MGVDRAVPALGLAARVGGLLQAIDLPSSLLNGFLSFLLFAGALHIDLKDLLRRKWTIGVLATAGVVISTALIGAGTSLVFRFVGLDLPLVECLIFGALISPTDPVAVLGMLQRSGVPQGLKATIAGESMFNDGVGIVIFTLLLGIAHGGERVGPVEVAGAFLLEAGGAVALGLATGWLAFLFIRTIDEYNLELLFALALAAGTYSLALALGVSGPIATVVAGLVIGNHGIRYGMSETTTRHLRAFWGFVDEALNAILFLLIGLEVAAVRLDPPHLAAAALAIPLALAARAISVAVPALPLHLHERQKGRAVALLTWAGLRGGISIALVLSLPAGAERDRLLAACYAVVLFTMVIQGLTVGRLAARLYPAGAAERTPSAAGAPGE
jgi:monovalent cation:H+ antiporter, CPA1 family